MILRSLNNTERVFKNATVKKVQEIEKQHPGEISKIYEYVKGDNYRKSFQETGDSTSSVWSCGQVIGLIESAPSCKVIIEDMVNEAADIIQGRLQQMIAKPVSNI